jgi:tryptophan 2,3-dioxygenase
LFGSQSVQFRLFENKLGLKRSQRLNYQKADYTQPLHPDHRVLVEEAEAEASLFDLIERWLERTPFMQGENFDFWQSYQEAVLVMLKEDRELIMNNSSMLEVQRTAMLNDIDHNWKLFESVLLEEEHNKLRQLF